MSDVNVDATNYTPREITLIKKCKLVMSEPFKKEFLNSDERILAFIELVVGDVNYFPPLTDYNVNSIPLFFDTIIILGTQMYTSLFLLQKWTMNDFTYNEGGISIAFDRVAKLSTAQEKFYDLYKTKTETVKKNQLNSMTLATPRFANQLGTFIRLAI